MTMTHQCSRCGYQGRVIELADRYLCEDCDELYQREERAAEICPSCGAEGVTSTGVCYACENSPEVMPQPDC
ncbi:hypothetical protein KVG88_30225 [Pseudomonas sp. SWRI74]|uniref:Uncharacterized protein n=1 Tax=Pseudomonas azerbaijanoccidentalis TaxID=2842347 RepID=A0ABS6QZM6_9PSED|nr:hypothetical protein [Pseudomonas azerbaijanoccidentalis]MBV4524353.1 hypothetical protein [Pseudomonas azerbaijanoccidentalis]